jgi:predicted nucleotidyltransferase
MSAPAPSAEREHFLERVKRAVHRVEPNAEVWLYGSQARGEAGPASDWDFLVLLDGLVGRARQKRIRRALYEIELDTERLVSSIIHSRAKWNDPPVRTPFQANVRRDGVVL